MAGFSLRVVAIAGSLVLLVVSLRGPLQRATLLTQAEVHARATEYTLATQAYQRLLSLRPSDAAAHLGLGRVYLRQGRYAQAEEEFARALASDANQVEAMNGLAAALGSLGRIDSAIPLWRATIERDPTNAEAHYRLGLAYLLRSRFGQAREELEAARRGRPGDPATYYYLGVLTSRGGSPQAAEFFEAAQALAPDSEWAQRALQLQRAIAEAQTFPAQAPRAAYLGQAYLRLGLPNLAAEAFERALELDPTLDLARTYWGYALWSMGRYAQGLSVLKEASLRDKRNALNHYFLALTLSARGRVAAALRQARSAVELDPENPALRAELGALYAIARDYASAREQYQAATEAAPEELSFHLLRARFHLEHLVWLDEGFEAARRAVELDPQSAEAHDLLGWAQQLLGDPQTAEESLLRALELDPGLASAYYHLGAVYIRRARWDDARWAYMRAIDLDGEGFYRERALNALAEL
ncbi:MAG: tetratricopeptide repeat protein, partial [Chloroflexi bacterium]|nr:tetratricopeptide repeat protein [Chloroflexota bacterium]